MPRAERTADRNLDRARVYRTLARLFRPPDADGIQTLQAEELGELRECLDRLGAEPDLAASVDELRARIEGRTAAELERGYDLAFDASAGLRCPANETSTVAETASEQMTKTYTLADIAGFYRAFGVEVGPGGGQPDHIAAELEFMQLLALKEAVAASQAENSEESEHAEICRSAARSFLKDHLGRWTARFAERLAEADADPAYAQAGVLLDRFVAFDALQLGDR